MFSDTFRTNPQLPDGLCALQNGHPCPLQRFRRRVEMVGIIWLKDISAFCNEKSLGKKISIYTCCV